MISVFEKIDKLESIAKIGEEEGNHVIHNEEFKLQVSQKVISVFIIPNVVVHLHHLFILAYRFEFEDISKKEENHSTYDPR